MVLFLSLELDCRIGQWKGSILTRWSHWNPAGPMGTHEYHFLGLKERLPVPVELVIFAYVFRCVRDFFPSLRSLGFLHQSGSSQALHGTTVRPGKCTSTLVSFLAKSWGPACPWGREHDDQLWVLHFRQNLIYDELWWLIYIEYIEYKRIYMIDTGIHTRPAFFVQRAKEYN